MDRDARIEARRQRIEARLGAKAGENDGKSSRKKDESAQQESRSETQIVESRERLDKVQTGGQQDVTKVRITGDARENERRGRVVL